MFLTIDYSADQAIGYLTKQILCGTLLWMAVYQLIASLLFLKINKGEILANVSHFTFSFISIEK